jgi:hypothetical protein
MVAYAMLNIFKDNSGVPEDFLENSQNLTCWPIWILIRVSRLRGKF